MKSSSRKPLVVIEPTITSIDNPESLSAQLDREPAFPFPYPELGEVDSLEAIGKDPSSKQQRKRSTKYKHFLGGGGGGRQQQQQQQEKPTGPKKKSGKEIPVLRPLYVSNSDRSARRNNYPYGGEKKDGAAAAAAWLDDERERYRMNGNGSGSHDKSIHSLSNSSGSIPRPGGDDDHHRDDTIPSSGGPGRGTARRSNKYSSRLRGGNKDPRSDDDDFDGDYDDDTRENDPGRSNKYSETLLRIRQRSLSFEQKPHNRSSPSSHTIEVFTTPRASSNSGGHHQRSLSPNISSSQHRQRSFSLDDAAHDDDDDDDDHRRHRKPGFFFSSSPRARPPKTSPATPVGGRAPPRSPFASLSQRRNRGRSVGDDDHHHPPKRDPRPSSSSSPHGARLPTTPTLRDRMPRSPFANLSQRRRQRSFSADDHKKRKTTTATTTPASPKMRSSLLRTLPRLRQRSGSVGNNDAPDPEQKVPAYPKIGSTTTTGSHQSGSSYMTGQVWKVSNSGGLSLESSSNNNPSKHSERSWKVSNSGGLSLVSSLQSSSTRNNTKHSRSSSLASSLDAGASPDGIIAFGAVLDHITKGGSILNANRVYQKEFQTRGRYRTDTRGAEKRKGYRYPDDPSYGKSYEASYEKSYEKSYEDSTTTTQTGGDDGIINFLNVLGGDSDETTESGLPCDDDKYATNEDEDGEDEDDEDDDDQDENDEEKSEDWCVPRPTTEDAATAGTETAGTAGTSTLLGVMSGDTGSVGFLGIDPFATPESEGSSDESDYSSSEDDDSDDDSDYSSSDDDVSDDDRSSADTGSDHSSSTISSYHSVDVLKQRETKTKVKRVSKTNKLLKILQGKKPVKSISIVNDGNGGSGNNGSTDKVVQVDRLPNSFEDDNDENINTDNNNLKTKGKKHHASEQHDSKPKPSESYEEQKRRSARKKSSKEKKKSKKKRHMRERQKEEKFTNDLEDVFASKIRVLKQLVGIEEVDDKEGPEADPPALKVVTNDASEQNSQGLSAAHNKNDSTRDSPVNEDAAVLPMTQTILPKLKEVATRAMQLTTPTMASPSEPNAAVEEDVPTSDEPVILKLPEKASTKQSILKVETPEPSCENDEKDENISICGASLALDSIISLESLLEGDTPTFLKTVVDTATQITNDSMRSARSMFFPDDGTEDLQEMTAVDEFEKEMDLMDDPVDMIIDSVCSAEGRGPGEPVDVILDSVCSAESGAPKEIWVPEYADCDEAIDVGEGADVEEEQQGRLEFGDGDADVKSGAAKAPSASTQTTTTTQMLSSSSTTKRKLFRKRIPFLQFKKGGTSSKPTEPEENIEDDSSTSSSSIQVDIFVYNREKNLLGRTTPIEGFDVSAHPHIYNGDKPLIDSTPSIDDGDEEGMPQTTMMASCTTQTMVPSCDMMVAAKNAVQEMEPTKHLVSLGMICCGEIPTAEQMMQHLQHTPAPSSAAADPGHTVSSSGNNNNDNNANRQEVVGTSLADCGAYYMEECLPDIEARINKNLLAAAAETGKMDPYRPAPPTATNAQRQPESGGNLRESSSSQGKSCNRKKSRDKDNSSSSGRDNNNSSRSQGRSLFGRRHKEGRRRMLV